MMNLRIKSIEMSLSNRKSGHQMAKIPAKNRFIIKKYSKKCEKNNILIASVCPPFSISLITNSLHKNPYFSHHNAFDCPAHYFSES